MKLSNFIEGLQILQKHYDGGDGYHLGSEHDVFYAYKTNTPLSPDEVRRMYELDWHQEDVEGTGPESYSVEASWAAYV